MAEPPSPGSASLDLKVLLDAGIAVQPFMAASRVRDLADCAALRREAGEFLPARVGGGTGAARREDIRGDHTCWLTEPLFAAERALLDDLERIRLDLNRDTSLGLFDIELHYAWYAPGTGYARHVDQLHARSQRQLSFVLYLNEGWQPGDGGELRIYDAAGAHRDIEPLAGRLVCFLTAGREHEVLATRVDRWSLTGWFKRRE